MVTKRHIGGSQRECFARDATIETGKCGGQDQELRRSRRVVQGVVTTDQLDNRASLLVRHPYATSLGLTLAWHAAIILLASVVPFPDSSVLEDLRAALVNLGAALVPLAVVARLGWWKEAGVARLFPAQRGLLVLPLLVIAIVPIMSGLEGSAGLLVSAAALQASLAFNEELMSRGVVQSMTAHLGAVRCALWVGFLFGMGHWFNALFFGSSLFDAAGQVVTSTAGGFCFAALRFHIVTLWPLVFLHGVENFLRNRSVEVPPIWLEVVAALFLAAYGWWLLKRLPENRVGTCSVT